MINLYPTATASGYVSAKLMVRSSVVNCIESLENRIAPATIFVVAQQADGPHLMEFDTELEEDAQTPFDNGLITGFASAGETILGIDFRPASGDLYVLTNSPTGARLYTIDTLLAELRNPLVLAADPADATNPFTTLTGTSFGIDFNPTVDRLRIVSAESNQNLRVNPNNGLVVTDGPVGYILGDPNFADNPSVGGSAYTNPVPGTTSTQLFGIDTVNDVLVSQNPPNNGTLNTIGALGVNAEQLVGFDIGEGSTTGFAALNVGNVRSLYSVNLATGAATLVGTIGNGAQEILGLAVRLEESTRINSTTRTYTDIDGDLVTIKVSKGSLIEDNLRLVGGGTLGGAQLALLDLSDNGDLNGATITITAKPQGVEAMASGKVMALRMSASSTQAASHSRASLSTAISADSWLGSMRIQPLELSRYSRLAPRDLHRNKPVLHHW